MLINGTNDIFEFCMQFIRWLKMKKKSKRAKTVEGTVQSVTSNLCLKKNIVKNEWKEMSGDNVILNTPAHHHC